MYFFIKLTTLNCSRSETTSQPFFIIMIISLNSDASRHIKRMTVKFKPPCGSPSRYYYLG